MSPDYRLYWRKWCDRTYTPIATEGGLDDAKGAAGDQKLRWEYCFSNLWVADLPEGRYSIWKDEKENTQ